MVISYSHKQKFKVNGQSVHEKEWKQTDRRMDEGDYITCRIKAIGNKRW